MTEHEARRQRVAMALLSMRVVIGPLRPVEDVFNDIGEMGKQKLLSQADQILALV